MRHWRGDRSTVERAVEIARNGLATDLDGIRVRLNNEGRQEVEAATSGMLIKAQLNQLIKERTAASGASTHPLMSISRSDDLDHRVRGSATPTVGHDQHRIARHRQAP